MVNQAIVPLPRIRAAGDEPQFLPEEVRRWGIQRLQ